MALFGENRDISLFRHLNRELINRIIEQKVGYYKLDLENTSNEINVYGESAKKFYRDPVLVNALLERGDQQYSNTSNGYDVTRNLVVRLLRDDLVEANLKPEVGDVILWNDDYFEVDSLNENQLIVGKDPSYSYDSTVNNFGSSWSIILTAHYVRPERFAITEQR